MGVTSSFSDDLSLLGQPLMMMHTGIHWPDMAQSLLWPMAVVHACFLFNHVLYPSTGLSPADIFSKTHWPQKWFHDLHVWGCPVNVLDKSIQDGKKIPKWQPQSHQSVYSMGVSPSHATSVPLVLNTNCICRVKKGKYNEIHDKIKLKRNLQQSFHFPFETARKCIACKMKLDQFGVPVGKQSPLCDAEDDIFSFLCLLVKLGSPVSCGQTFF
jgi:hypothetical protein